MKIGVTFMWVFWDCQLVKTTNLSKLTGTILLAHEIQVRFYLVLVIPCRSFDYEFLNFYYQNL